MMKIKTLFRKYGTLVVIPIPIIMSSRSCGQTEVGICAAFCLVLSMVCLLVGLIAFVGYMLTEDERFEKTIEVFLGFSLLLVVLSMILAMIGI